MKKKGPGRGRWGKRKVEQDNAEEHE